MSDQDNNAPGWRWWIGESDEWYQVSGATRAEALAKAAALYNLDTLERLYICEARLEPFAPIAFDRRALAEMFDDANIDRGSEDDPPAALLPAGALDDLRACLDRAAEAWAARLGVASCLFSESRNEQAIELAPIRAMTAASFSTVEDFLEMIESGKRGSTEAARNAWRRMGRLLGLDDEGGRADG